MTDLAGLIERLEGADYAVMSHPERWGLTQAVFVAGGWKLHSFKQAEWWERDGEQWTFGPLLASLDAAVAFAERVFLGCRWRVERLPIPMTDGSAVWPFWASCGLPGAQEAAYGETAPIALLIATLRALQASTAEEAGHG